MYKSFFHFMVSPIILLHSLTASPTSHILEGSDYGEKGAAAYIASPSSFDRDKFLKPHLFSFMDNVSNQVVLDAGCGPAHDVLYMAQHGAKVFGIDINEKMIAAGMLEIYKAGLAEKASLNVGNVAFLPYRSEMFDRAISINVACNLPSQALNDHFEEMGRVLKIKGEAIISVPISLETVFTNGLADKKEAMAHIYQLLNNMDDNPSTDQIYTNLMTLQEVVNATFAIKNNRLVLITDKNELELGEPIWRKLPVLVVPNYYHTEEEYLEVLSRTHLKVEKIVYPYFSNEQERLEYNAKASPNAQFGPDYSNCSSYALLYVVKERGVE